jgi:hypothetical protein
MVQRISNRRSKLWVAARGSRQGQLQIATAYQGLSPIKPRLPGALRPSLKTIGPQHPRGRGLRKVSGTHQRQSKPPRFCPRKQSETSGAPVLPPRAALTQPFPMPNLATAQELLEVQASCHGRGNLTQYNFPPVGLDRLDRLCGPLHGSHFKPQPSFTHDHQRRASRFTYSCSIHA